MLNTRLSGPRACSNSPSIRAWFGQSVVTITGNWPGARSQTSYRSAAGRNASTSGTGCGPANVGDQPAPSSARPSANRVPSTSASGCTWPRSSTRPPCAESAPSSAAGGAENRSAGSAIVAAPRPRATRPAPRLGAGQERLHPRGVLHGAVGPEGQLGRHAQVQVAAEPRPHESPRALERLEGLDPLRVVAEHRHEHLGLLEV